MAEFDDSGVQQKVAELHGREIEERVRALGGQIGVPYINLEGVTINPEALTMISEEDARQHELVGFMLEGTKVLVGMKNPKNPEAQKVLDQLRGAGRAVQEYIISEASLQHVLERYADVRATAGSERGGFAVDPEMVQAVMRDIHSHLDVDTMLHTIAASDDTDKVSRAVSVLFAGAQALDASDIHIEPEEGVIRVRFRIDGVLWEVTNLSPELYRTIRQRIKLLSGMRLNIQNQAQDGRLGFSLGETEIDVRVSVIPGGHGESIVMRLLNPDTSRFNIETLGLNERLRAVVEEELARPNGAIVTTGPTGSGKTTALYSFLRYVYKPGVKIITIEDPIEYKLPGVVQTQTSDQYTFASGLRAILRQDPDIIMVGEIRDLEVAETAVHAALTGHLVFSTLHTNSAVGAIPRLIDIGIEPSIIASAFNLMMGQRLARRLCENCREQRQATVDEIALMTRILGEPPKVTMLYYPKGCEKCGMSGYKGRIGLFEAIRMTTELTPYLRKGITEGELLEVARSQNIPSMQQDGIMKVMAGVTALEELERVVDLHKL